MRRILFTFILGATLFLGAQQTILASTTAVFSVPVAYAADSAVPTPTSDDKTTDDGGFVPCGNRVDDPCNVSHLFRAFIGIINYLIAMAGFVAVLFIVVSGVQMVASQGQEGLKAAKGRLSGAIIGLVLVAISFILINTLFEGSLNIGVCNGANVFTNPRDYINNETRCDGK